jgi:hypothetical protein
MDDGGKNGTNWVVVGNSINMSTINEKQNNRKISPTISLHQTVNNKEKKGR